MRKLLAMLLVAGAAQAAGVSETVDLNAPGALESLKARKPEHVAKVAAILDYVRTHPTQPNSRPLIEARFDAADVEMLQWRVSDPPKLRLGFTLDSTRYNAEVVPALPPARAIPAR